MALFGQKPQKGDTGNYYATFTPEEIVQRTPNMFKTADGGLHTFNGQIDDDLCSMKHDYTGDKNSMMASQWKYELQKQAKIDAEKAQQAREVAEYQALREKAGVPLSMDKAREKGLDEYNKVTTEKIQNREEGYSVAPVKQESVEDVLDDMDKDTAYAKKPSVSFVADVSLEKDVLSLE